MLAQALKLSLKGVKTTLGRNRVLAVAVEFCGQCPQAFFRMQFDGIVVKLTDQQKDLLRLLVSKHESSGGSQFIFLRGINGAGLCYPGEDAVNVAYDDIDLRQLRRENLISVIPIAENQLRGKPTELGIEIVHRGFFIKRAMKEYEARCPLLSSAVKELLNQRGEPLETELSRRVESAGAAIRKRREELKQITDDRAREAAESALLQEAAVLRRGVIEVAEAVAAEGVRGFANGLQSSQGRLGVHANLLREYTAGFASEIRNWLNASQAFQMEKLPPWRQDSITQQAIQTCEDVLAETKRIEAGGPSGMETTEGGAAGHNEDEPGTWTPIVQEWEALKSSRRIMTCQHERIPDADLRSILAGQYGIKPEDVNEGQIEYAAVELCRHYGRFQIVPSAPPDSVPAADAPKPRPIPDAGFWKERKGAFHQYDTGENRALGAMGFSGDNHWLFHASSGATPDVPVRIFKPLAIEAAKGLGSKRGAESWMDWLDLLSSAKDEATGASLYAKRLPGSFAVSDRELQRMIEAGEVVPGGGLIEFVGTEDGGIERRTYWDTNGAVIENLFTASANQCLKLQSLPLHPKPSAGDGTQQPRVAIKKAVAQHESMFPERAEWLRIRLIERGWNRHDPLRQRGPDPKTIDKILAGGAVREDVQEKLANALSTKYAKVNLLDIPQS
jgi:hypothetical protein